MFIADYWEVADGRGFIAPQVAFGGRGGGGGYNV